MKLSLINQIVRENRSKSYEVETNSIINHYSLSISCITLTNKGVFN